MRLTNFNSLFARYAKLYKEDNTAGSGGAFGTAPSMSMGGEVPGGSDFYAPNDSRNVFGMGTYDRRGKLRKKKKKGKKKIDLNPTKLDV